MIHLIRILILLTSLVALAAGQGFGPPGSGDGGDPVTILDASFEPASVAPGGTTELVVEVAMAPGWHIYSVKEASGQTPTRVVFEVKGLEVAGELIEPEPVENHGQTYHEDTFKLRLPVKVTDEAKSTVRFRGELTYMACNEAGCRPPESKDLSARLAVKKAPAAAANAGGTATAVSTDSIKGPKGFVSIVARTASQLVPGGEVEIEIKGTVVDGRWTYSAAKPVGYARPSSIAFADSPHYTAIEGYSETDPELKKAKEEWDQDAWIHKKDFSIRRKIRLADDLPGRISLEGSFEGQTCDPAGCVDFKIPFRLVLKPGAAAAGGPAPAASGALLEAIEGLYDELAILRNGQKKLLPQPVVAAPPKPEWAISDVAFKLDGTPRAGETTPLVMTFKTPDETQLGPVANLFVDYDSKRIQSIEAISASSSKDGLEHTVTMELKATDVAQSGEEEIGIEVSVPLLVDGYEYDFESAGHKVAATFGLPNVWDWVLRSIFAALLALLTPCVFPMIPVTVSYFTKQSEGGGGGLFLPIVYALGIIVSFVLIGVGFTLAAGATGANVLATNGYVQAGFGLLFILFALSLFGVYDLRPPAFLMSKAGAVQGKGGVGGVLGMGLLFSLTTFTCTAPLVGLILVAAAETNEWVLPIIGMFAFATTLALPFFVLSLFPKLMSGLPKSGGWLAKVKVTLGFLEMAFAFKFFGAMDAYFGWGLFTRETILWIWVILFILNGLYLLGLIRFDKFEEFAPAGPLIGAVSVMLVVFGLYLIQGAQGKKMPYLVESLMPPKEVSGGEGLGWASHGLYKNDLEKAVAAAKERGVGLFIDFTGYT